jgi:hypothetical protein
MVLFLAASITTTTYYSYKTGIALPISMLDRLLNRHASSILTTISSSSPSQHSTLHKSLLLPPKQHMSQWLSTLHDNNHHDNYNDDDDDDDDDDDGKYSLLVTPNTGSTNRRNTIARLKSPSTSFISKAFQHLPSLVVIDEKVSARIFNKKYNMAFFFFFIY